MLRPLCVLTLDGGLFILPHLVYNHGVLLSKR